MSCWNINNIQSQHNNFCCHFHHYSAFINRYLSTLVLLFNLWRDRYLCFSKGCCCIARVGEGCSVLLTEYWLLIGWHDVTWHNTGLSLVSCSVLLRGGWHVIEIVASQAETVLRGAVTSLAQVHNWKPFTTMTYDCFQYWLRQDERAFLKLTLVSV